MFTTVSAAQKMRRRRDDVKTTSFVHLPPISQLNVTRNRQTDRQGDALTGED